MNTTAKKNDELTPKHVAAMALEASGNIITDATNWMIEWMNEHPEWERNYSERIRRSWVVEVCRCEVKDMRYVQASGSPNRDAGDRALQTVVPFRSTLTDAINANYSRMMDSPLWGGKPIGNATPQEIRDSAEQFFANGKTMMRRATWQFKVAEAAENNGCGINEPVRTALTARTFDELWEQSNVA